MNKRRNGTMLDRFVIMTFTMLLVGLSVLTAFTVSLAFEQLTRIDPLASFSGEAIIIGREAVTVEDALFPWEESYRIQLGTLEGINGWLSISKGNYYRLQSEDFVCLHRMEVLYECPENWEKWPEFMRDRK